jgi:hypothetical protein
VYVSWKNCSTIAIALSILAKVERPNTIRTGKNGRELKRRTSHLPVVVRVVSTSVRLSNTSLNVVFPAAILSTSKSHTRIVMLNGPDTDKKCPSRDRATDDTGPLMSERSKRGSASSAFMSQIRTALPAAAAILFPSSETATDSTSPSASSCLRRLRVCKSHIRTVLSSEPEIIHPLVSEIATDQIQSVCPVRDSPTCSPVSKSQILTVSSADPDTTCLPLVATDRIRLLCPCRVRSCSPVSVFHILIVLSSDPETMYFPSSENATELTSPVCPWSGLPTCSPVSTFQILTVSSTEPETIRAPSLDTATDQTARLCPVRGSPIAIPVCASQTRTNPSYDPETASFPLAEIVEQRIVSVCPENGTDSQQIPNQP